MYKLVAVIYDHGTLVGFKVTNKYVEEELTISETYILALSGLIVDVEAGSTNKFVGRNGFDIKTLPRIDRGFGKAPAYHKIAAYIAKSSSRASNMLFKPDLIVKQAILNIEKDKERDLDEPENFSDSLIINGIAYDLNYEYLMQRVNKLNKEDEKEKYTKLLEENKASKTAIDIAELEIMILKSLGYNIEKINEYGELPNIIKDTLARERTQYRKLVGYEVINCGTEVIKYKKHNLDSKITDDMVIAPGEKDVISEYDLKLLMSENKFNGKIANASLGFVASELEIKDGVHFINKCILLKTNDNIIDKRQVYIGELEKGLG